MEGQHQPLVEPGATAPPAGTGAEDARPRPRLRVPVVTLAVVGLQALMWLLLVRRTGGQEDALPHLLLAGGAKVAELVRDGEWWRIPASGFLHGSVNHLLTNGLGILLLGLFVESVFGPWLQLLALPGAMAGGALLSAWLGDTTSVGASGGFFGLMGASAAYALRHWARLPRGLRTYALALPAGAAVASLVHGWSLPGVDSVAHLGGFLLGVALGAAGPAPARRVPRPAPLVLAAGFLVLALDAGALAAAVDRLGGHVPPAGPALVTTPGPEPRLHLPEGWAVGVLEPPNRCAPSGGQGVAALVAQGRVACLSDSLYTVLLVGREEALSTVPMYQEAALRETGAPPSAFLPLELRFHVRSDGLAFGLLVFRPLLDAYLPLFLAASGSDPGSPDAPL